MRPEFGSNVAEYAFSPLAHSSKAAIAYDVREQLLLQEPRIVDVQAECKEQDGNAGTLLIDVAYTVRSTNNRYNQVYPFICMRERKNEQAHSRPADQGRIDGPHSAPGWGICSRMAL